MEGRTNIGQNVKQLVPLLAVSSMENSLRFYMDGLGCTMRYKWIDGNKLRWCWLELGGAAIMLQEIQTEGHHAWKPEGKLGLGVSFALICDDAIQVYKELKARGMNASRPMVGNSMWVTELTDPDGYPVFFESYTQEKEDTVYTG